MNLKYISIVLTCGVVGVVTALILLWIIPRQTLPDSPLLQTLGIRKPMILGFLPYWLLDSSSSESLQQLNRVTYFGLVVNDDGTVVQQSKPGEAEPGWHKLDNGEFSEKMKTISKGSADYSLLIHQSNEASISALIKNPELHAQNLVSAVEPIMKQYGFVDLNLDIESFREASPEAQANMTTFLQTVKKEMVDRDLGTLTTELTVSSLFGDKLMNPIEVGEISDHVVIMAYDYRYTGSFLSGAVAPTGGGGEKIEYDIDTSLKLATEQIPSEKILLGIPLYGYEWETLSYQPESPVIPGTGKSATINRVTALLQRCGETSKDSPPTVTLSTEEVIESSDSASPGPLSCIKGRDELTGSPYLILPPNEDSSIQQIYYEDEQSLQKKLQLANKYRLGGIAFWAIGYETPEFLKPIEQYEREFEGS